MRHVVPGKDAQISDRFGYLIVLVELDEEALQSLGRNFICNAVWIGAGAAFSIAISLRSVPKI
jgi:hypothetical protein